MLWGPARLLEIWILILREEGRRWDLMSYGSGLHVCELRDRLGYLGIWILIAVRK